MMEVNLNPATNDNDLQKWEGYDIIKNFYCMPEVPIDFDKLSRARLRYWDMNRHIYDESRLIQIDTHRPSDMGVERATSAQVQQSFKHWTIQHGPRDVIADSVSKGKDGTKCEERVAVLKEKSESIAKEKKISELQLLVEKLSRQKEQLAKLPTKQSSSAKESSTTMTVPTAEGSSSSSSIGKKRRFPAVSEVLSPPLIVSSPYHQYPHHLLGPQYHQYPSPHPGVPPYQQYHPSPPVPVTPFQQYHHLSPVPVPQYQQHPSPLPYQQYTSPAVFPSAPAYCDNYSSIHNQWAEDMKRKEYEVSVKEKRLKALELDMEAAKKELALRSIQQLQVVSKARADLDLQVINNDKREMMYAARARQQFLNDQDHNIRYQQISEDRLFMKEAVRRQWQVEDRKTENNTRRNHNRDLIDMASRSNETIVLQTMINAQRQGSHFPQPAPPPPAYSHQLQTVLPPLPQKTADHYHSSPTFFPTMPMMPPRHQGNAPQPAAKNENVAPAQTLPFGYNDVPSVPSQLKDVTMSPELNAQSTEEKSFDNMSSEEIEKYLSQAQAQLDSEMGVEAQQLDAETGVVAV